MHILCQQIELRDRHSFGKIVLHSCQESNCMEETLRPKNSFDDWRRIFLIHIPKRLQQYCWCSIYGDKAWWKRGTETENAVKLNWIQCGEGWRDGEKGRGQGRTSRKKVWGVGMEMEGGWATQREVYLSTQRCCVGVWRFWLIVLPCYLVSPVLHSSFVGVFLPDTSGTLIPL